MEENDLSHYEEFIRRKNRRPLIDAYSCFQPFNEATKAIFPFVSLLKKQLKPADVILNLWDRSGWLTSLLAGLFPEQIILTVWEGDRDVLGRKGYGFWFSRPDAPANVQILFHDLHQPLPLPTHTVALVIGPDVLHRHDLATFLGELLRVVRPDGGLLFPHVHLANAEPVPYFERGGELRTGRTYQTQIGRLDQLGNRRPFVLSEPDLFQFNTQAPAGAVQPLMTAPDTPDYNALLAILPPNWAAQPLTPFRTVDEPDWSAHRVILNTLVTIDYTTGRVRCQPDRMGGIVGHLLERHPVYEELLRASDDYVLSATALCFLYWAARQLTVAEIAGRLGKPVGSLRDMVTDLARRDLIQLVAISASGTRLQHYLSFQTYQESYTEQTLPVLWKRAVSEYGDQAAFINLDDDSTFSYADADGLMGQLRSALTADGLKPGDRVLIIAPLHLESLLLTWACWQNGLVVVPVSPDLPAQTRAALFATIAPSLIVTTPDEPAPDAGTVPIVWLDTDSDREPPAGVRWFADWISHEWPLTDSIAGTAEDIAAILFTSGSTGQPKGVPLTHGQLCRGGRLMTETFGWEKEDRFLTIGNLDAMSGLRNATSAVAGVGAAVVVPTPANRLSGAAMSEAVAAGQVTLLAASPSLLRQWVQYSQRVVANLRTLRVVMSTGSLLTPDLRQSFKTTFNRVVVNYYGLTETAGICLAERPNQVQLGVDTIGWPVGCLAQAVDSRRQPVLPGQVGELRIYGENNMTGSYTGSAADSPVVDGWLYTGDLVIVNENGSFTLRGRQSERIKNAHSEVVYPSEVEAQLLTHPAVADAAVCSFVRHDTETLAAFLTLNDTNDSRAALADISAHLLARVGPRKLPSVFRIIDEMPRTNTGKVMKKSLLTLLDPE